MFPQPPQQCGSMRGPRHSAKATQQWQNLLCIINTTFSTNPKHSPILAGVEKINFAPAKIVTVISVKCHWNVLEWESIIFYTDKTFFIPKVCFWNYFFVCVSVTDATVEHGVQRPFCAKYCAHAGSWNWYAHAHALRWSVAKWWCLNEKEWKQL